MKKFILLFILLTTFNIKYTFSQCNSFFNYKNGMIMELETFNAKNKKTGKIINQVKNYSEGSNKYEALINSTYFDDKDKQVSTGEYVISCNNGTIQLDLKSLIPQESLSAYESMEVTFTGDHLEIPNSLKQGDQLKDGNLYGEVKDKSSNNTFSTLDFKITDRTVEGKESVTTNAGTFECYKIAYNMILNTRMMGINIPVNMKGIDYIAPSVGVVKSEMFNKNGKLGGYTLLSKIN
jgi:hypothetical protein